MALSFVIVATTTLIGLQFALGEITRGPGINASDAGKLMALNSTRQVATEQQCRLRVTEESASLFTYAILHERYNMVYLKLNFINVTVQETDAVISKDKWIWTYKGGNGGYPYLYLPTDYGYLSFGILSLHTFHHRFHVNLTYLGTNCSNLKVGTNYTDNLIGQALARMTSGIVSRDDIYNSSYWCYSRRFRVHSDVVYNACRNLICTLQTVEYHCCKFQTNYLAEKLEVVCPDKHYEFAGIWWAFPIIAGVILLAYFPLILTRIGSKVHDLSRSIQHRNRRYMYYNYERSREEDDSMNEAANARLNTNGCYVRLKYGTPISFVSTICSPFLHLNVNGMVTKRIVRVAFIVLPMTLSAIKVFLDYKNDNSFVKDVVKKGGIVGFSSMLAGYEVSRQTFLILFGGPYVAISIYVLFGCILLSIPSRLEETFQAGLFMPTGDSTFILQMSVEKRERYSRVYFQNCQGYEKINRYMKAMVWMLLNAKFWRYVIRLFISRWRCNVYFCLIRRFKRRPTVLVVMAALCPVYVVFCLAELIISLSYFAFPVINSFFRLYRALFVFYRSRFSRNSRLWNSFQVVLFVPISLCYFVSWFMYCLFFFDGLWFLSKVAMFTYSGVFAYPKISYGYLILVFMTALYLAESVNDFGESYTNLLSVTIAACQKIEKKRQREGEDIRILHKRGVPLDMFGHVVEMHLPIRNQLIITLLKFVSIVNIICISVGLLRRFGMFADLALIAHVFTVLFVSALPMIVRSVFLGRHKYRSHKTLKRQIERTIVQLLPFYPSNHSDDDNSYPRELQEP